MEIERLIAYFDADDSKAKPVFDRVYKRVSDIEQALKRLKTDFVIKIPGFSGNIRELREIANLQGGQARTERAIALAKQATLGVVIKEVQLEKELARLKESQSRQKAAPDTAMQRALADIARMQRETEAGEKRVTQSVQRESKAQADSRIREFKRAANERLREIAVIERKEKSTQRRSSSGSARNSALEGLSTIGAAITGGIVGGGLAGAGIALVGLTKQGREAYASLDTLVRFTATLDRNFQSVQGINKLRKDIEKLSLEVPQTAENIAKASFTIKSSYQNLTEPELIQFLREFSIAATGSNTTVDAHVERVSALAKMYGITAKELTSFSALIATAFGDALSSDAKVGDGFSKILVSARNLKQPLNDVVAAMAAIQSTSNDAEKNTTNLQNVFAKLGDPKYIADMKEFLKVDVFDAQGNFKGLNTIINEIAKSIQGLNDEQRNLKLGSVFRDLQAREGILALIEVIDTYNDRLKNGADANAFAAKTNTMLNSAEARWTKFNNFISQIQRDAGQKFTIMFDNVSAQETGGSAIRAFFVDLGAELISGFTYLTQLTAQWYNTLIGAPTDWILKLLGYDPVTVDAARAEQKKQVDDWFNSFYVNIENNRSNYQNGIRTSQIDYFKNVLASPIASPAVKAEAQKSLDSLMKIQKENLTAAAQSNYENWKALAAQAVKGLQSANPQIKAEAINTVRNLNVEIANAINSGNYTDDFANRLRELWTSLPATASTAGKETGTAFTQGVTTGITSNQSLVQNNQLDLFSAPTAQINSAGNQKGSAFSSAVNQGILANRSTILGQTLSLFATPTEQIFGFGSQKGSAFSEGIDQGMISNRPNVGGFLSQIFSNSFNAFGFGSRIGRDYTAGIQSGLAQGMGPVRQTQSNQVNSLFQSGQRDMDAHSPSRRAARELGKPFAQGIAVGLLAEQANLRNAASSLINSALFDKSDDRKKTKKKGRAKKTNPDETIRETIEDLQYANQRIDRDAASATDNVDRFYDALLADRTAGAETEIGRVNEYFQKIFEIEDKAYQDRLANIAQREDQIRALKKIKPSERSRELLKLADERTDTNADFDKKKDSLSVENGKDVLASVMRNIERQKRIFARELKIGSLDKFGTKRTASEDVQAEYTDKFRLINQEISLLEKERANFAAGTVARIELENKIADKIQDRADLEVDKSEAIIRAREEDKRSLEDYKRSILDFVAQTTDAQLSAERQKIEMLKATGASKEVIHQAEIELSMREENINHRNYLNELERRKADLISLATTTEQKEQILAAYHAQVESENARHNSASTTINAGNEDNSIGGRLRKMMNDLPGYKQIWDDFVVSLPNSMADALGQIASNWDGTWKGLADSAKRAFGQMLLDLAQQYLQSAFAKLIGSLVGKLVGALGGSLSGPSGTQMDGIDFSSHPMFGGGFASGGVPPLGRASIVGENGPEIFVPRINGRVLSNEDSVRAISGANASGGMVQQNISITQTIHAPRGTVAPKSARQAADMSVSAVARSMKQ